MKRLFGKSIHSLNLALILALLWGMLAPTAAFADDYWSLSRSGTAAMKVQLSTPPNFSNSRQLVNVTSNTAYNAKIWVKGTGSLLLLVKAGNWGATIAQQKCDASSGWTSCSVAFNSGSSTQVTFIVSDNYAGTSAVYVDDSFLGTAGGANLLQNGGFESGNAGWTMSTTGLWTIVQSSFGSYTYQGDWSLQATIPSTPTFSGMTQTIANAAPNTSYVGKIWLKGGIGIRLLVKAGTWGANLGVATCSANTSGWTECATPAFNTGSNTQLTFVVSDGAPGSGGVVFMDSAFLGSPSGTNLLKDPGFEDGYVNPWNIANKQTWVIDNHGVNPPQAPPAPVEDGTLYVHPDGANGAFTSIRQAVKAARAGTTIIVKDGVYAEGPIYMTYSGTASRPIVLKAEADDAVVKSTIEVYGQYVRIEGLQFDGESQYSGTPGVLRNAISVNADHVDVVDNRFKDYVGYAVIAEYKAGQLPQDTYIGHNYANKTASAFQVGSNSIVEYNEVEQISVHNTDEPQGDFLRVFGSDIVVRHNYLHGTHLADLYRPSTPSDPAHADVVQSWDDNNIDVKRVLIENNVFLGYYQQGLMLENDKNGVNGIYRISDWTIRNNVFGGVGSSGAFLGKTNGGIPNMVFENNTFTSAITDGQPAFYGINAVGTGGSTVLRNNIFVGFGTSTYGASQGSAIDADYNLIYNGSVPVATGPNDIIGLDPKFIAFDPLRTDTGLVLNVWRLGADSPAINNGTTRSFGTDLEGNVRPTGSGFDIGAYEFTGTVGNIPPVATLVGVTDGQVGTVNDTLSVHVNAKDSDGIQKVELYRDGQLIDTKTAQPYDFDYTVLSGVQRLKAVAYDTTGLSSPTREVLLVGSSGSYVLASRDWQNVGFSAVTGQAVVEYSVIPTSDSINGVIGLSGSPASAYSALAAIVRLNPTGQFDAYTTGGYASESTLDYAKGTSYKVRLEIDVPAKKYRVLITPQGGQTQVIGESFSFRAQATTLSNLAVFADAGNMLVTDFQVLPYSRQEV